jgi:hypothetical protein
MISRSLFVLFFIFSSVANALTLDGTVYGDNNPLNGALIRLKNNNDQSITNTNSNSLGQYYFTVNANTSYTVDITPPTETSFVSALNNEVIIQDTNKTQNFYLFDTQVSLATGDIKLPNGKKLTNGAEFRIQSTTQGGVGANVNSVGSYSVSLPNGT